MENLFSFEPFKICLFDTRWDIPIKLSDEGDLMESLFSKEDEFTVEDFGILNDVIRDRLDDLGYIIPEDIRDYMIPLIEKYYEDNMFVFIHIYQGKYIHLWDLSDGIVKCHGVIWNEKMNTKESDMGLLFDKIKNFHNYQYNRGVE